MHYLLALNFILYGLFSFFLPTLLHPLNLHPLFQVLTILSIGTVAFYVLIEENPKQIKNNLDTAFNAFLLALIIPFFATSIYLIPFMIIYRIQIVAELTAAWMYPAGVGIVIGITVFCAANIIYALFHEGLTWLVNILRKQAENKGVKLDP